VNLAGWQARSLVHYRYRRVAGSDSVNITEGATLSDTLQHLVHLAGPFVVKNKDYSDLRSQTPSAPNKVLQGVTLPLRITPLKTHRLQETKESLGIVAARLNEGLRLAPHMGG